MKIFIAVLYCALTRVFSQDIHNFRVKFSLLQKDLWDFVDDYVNDSISEINIELYLMSEIKKFDDQLRKEFSDDLGHDLKAIENVDVWKKTQVELKHIHELYESFRRFEKLDTTSPAPPEEQWRNMVQSILESGKFTIEQAQKSVTEFILEKNLYNDVLNNIKGDIVCEMTQSQNQILYNLYNMIEVTALKGYIMTQFFYIFLKLNNKRNFSKDVEIINDHYKEKTRKTVEYVKKAMQLSSRQLWKCDPKKHIPNETYIEVTGLLQGYVVNEVNLDPKKNTCCQKCDDYTYTKDYRCFDKPYCSKQRRCNGKLINCEYVDSVMYVCPASSIGRRYEYIEYDNGRVFGQKTKCDTVEVKSWNRWFVKCSYCFCLCDEQGVRSDRYINMRSVIADIENNRVVTGMRFVKKNRIIHLQIQQGELLPQGKINQSTVQWVQPEDYKITQKRSIHNNQDYYTLTWEQRSIDLDDLTADDGYILTGVRFQKIGIHLNFEIYVSPFDFKSGKLNQPIHTSEWKHNDNTDITTKNRTKVHLISPGIPTTSSFSKPSSESNQYIMMSHTDFDKDAAQTTIPFFDAQPVVSSVPVPLSGAGIFHKSVLGSGGFIAPKIITYDYGRHLNAEFP